MHHLHLKKMFIGRDNCTIVEVARSTIHAIVIEDLDISNNLDNLYILDRTINSRNHTKILYDCIFGEKPSIDHCHVFGCRAFEQNFLLYNSILDTLL